MNIFQFLRILWARRMIIIVSTIACFVAGLVALMLLPRDYAATSRIMIDTAKPDPSSTTEISPASLRSYIPTQAQVISDYRVAARAAENLGWSRDPAQQAAYQEYRDNNAGKPDLMDFDHWIAGQISGNVTAGQFQATNFIDITYRGPSADYAAQMANAVRQAYIDETTAGKRRDAVQVIDVLSRQLDEVRTQREAAEQKLVAFQRATGVVLLDNNTDADAARLQALAGAAPAGQSTVVGGTTVNPNATQIAAIDARIASEAATLGPNHPMIQDLRRQRSALAAAPVSTPGRTVSTGGTSLAAESSRVLSQRDKVEEAKRMASDVQVLRDQYQTIAARIAALRQQATTSDFSIVPMDSATPPTSPDSPKIPLIVGGSLALGFVLGVLIALILEFVRRRVRGVEDLASVSEVPVIGVINAPPKASLSIA